MRTVLLCSRDPELSALLTVNLERRDFTVQWELWSPCCEWIRDGHRDVDLVIADLDCQEPGCWDAATRLRGAYQRQPLILLGYAWSAPSRLLPLKPFSYVRKPFGIVDLLHVMRVYVAFPAAP